LLRINFASIWIGLMTGGSIRKKDASESGSLILGNAEMLDIVGPPRVVTHNQHSAIPPNRYVGIGAYTGTDNILWPL
jgi:hypothetical protein